MQLFGGNSLERLQQLQSGKAVAAAAAVAHNVSPLIIILLLILLLVLRFASPDAKEI